jgi:hypothetical protein
MELSVFLRDCARADWPVMNLQRSYPPLPQMDIGDGKYTGKTGALTLDLVTNLLKEYKLIFDSHWDELFRNLPFLECSGMPCVL